MDIERCPECLNTDLFRSSFMIVCTKCGNLLKEHLQFVEQMIPNRDSNCTFNLKTDYDINRIRNLLAKKESQYRVTFDADFIQSLNDYVSLFVKGFSSHQYNRKNFISIEHIILRFCQNYGYQELGKYFKMLKTKKIRDIADEIIKEIDGIYFKRSVL